MKTRREERKARGKALMGKYTQKQRTDTAHCLRSRPQQQLEEDHIPDILERQFEEWIDQEGITIEGIHHTYRNKMDKRKRKRTNHL